jgi:hypothetical protein
MIHTFLHYLNIIWQILGILIAVIFVGALTIRTGITWAFQKVPPVRIYLVHGKHKEVE